MGRLTRGDSVARDNSALKRNVVGGGFYQGFSIEALTVRNQNGAKSEQCRIGTVRNRNSAEWVFLP